MGDAWPAAIASAAPALEGAASASETPSQTPEVIEAEALLAWRRELLRAGGRASDLDWLLDLAGGVGWGLLQKLRLQPRRAVVLRQSRPALAALWAEHRQRHVPLQYLVGRCPWRDLELQVGPGVLIPRQETEILLDLVLQAVDRPGSHRCGDAGPALPPPALWADLGTGSGCLALALARAFPGSRGLAVDLSAAALAQAQGNLQEQRLDTQVMLLCGTWWEPLQPWWGQIHLAVANPPYIPTAVLAELDPVVRDHEPRLALDGGTDGLEALRPIIGAAPVALAPGGLLLVEHHHDQSEAVLGLMAAAGLRDPRGHHDLEGVARFASAFRSGCSPAPQPCSPGISSPIEHPDGIHAPP